MIIIYKIGFHIEIVKEAVSNIVGHLYDLHFQGLNYLLEIKTKSQSKIELLSTKCE